MYPASVFVYQVSRSVSPIGTPVRKRPLTTLKADVDGRSPTCNTPATNSTWSAKTQRTPRPAASAAPLGNPPQCSWLNAASNATVGGVTAL